MRILKTYKLFESTESVEDICQKYRIHNWTLNPDGTVDVDGDVYLYNKGLKELPLKFGKVTGSFDCSSNNLTGLEGSPNWVGGDFYCPRNKLTNLEGSPKEVGGDFSCSNNKLINLEGGPNWVGVDFFCYGNKLTNLEGCPEKIFGDLYCRNNKIHSLEYYPTILTGKLWTVGNPIFDIWKYVIVNKPNNHGVLLTIFDLHGPLRYVDGELVCNRECLDNFFDEIGVPKPPKLNNYKEV